MLEANFQACKYVINSNLYNPNFMLSAKKNQGWGLAQEGHQEFEANLDYIPRPYLNPPSLPKKSCSVPSSGRWMKPAFCPVAI